MTINDAELAELSELVACTLLDTDLKTQRERWVNVGSNFGRGRTEADDGLRLLFVDHPAVEEELRALVAVENECCSWAAWSVERDNGLLVMAARSQGDLQSAWDAVEAGWVRASLATDRGAALRADLDRLMLVAIIPERARLLAQPADALKLEWERFKERWR